MKTWHIAVLVALALAVVYFLLRSSRAAAAAPAATAAPAPARPMAPPTQTLGSRVSSWFGGTVTTAGTAATRPSAYVPGGSNSTVRGIASGGVSYGLGALGINFP